VCESVSELNGPREKKIGHRCRIWASHNSAEDSSLLWCDVSLAEWLLMLGDNGGADILKGLESRRKANAGEAG
jgi:hypothetical protein